MDPFLDSQLWADFHTAFLVGVREALTPQLAPAYVARIEERVYVEHTPDESRLRPDLSSARGSGTGPASGAATVAEPVTVPIAMPETVTERFLELRLRDSREVVGVLELLSPTNKRRHADGRREYLHKRDPVVNPKALPAPGAALVRVEAPFERVPLFVRGGTVLPLAPASNRVPLEATDLELLVFPDASGAARGSLYETTGTAWPTRTARFAGPPSA